MIPYFVMAILYLSMAFLMALDVALVDWQILPWFNGTVWLRVHLITLGVLTQVIFAVTPALVAIHYRLPRPKFRWDIWLLLNVGILTLLVGMPLVNHLLILIGGTLVFLATILLVIQVAQMRPQDQPQRTERSHAGRKFYLAGLSYFLLGIIVGTGIFLGWAKPLFINTPKEVHIHANNWGMMSLIFAGLIVDIYPVVAKRSLANPKSIPPIFWLMTLGAFGLIFGPWFDNTYLLVPGLILHLIATIWLLYNVIKPLWGDREAWTLGLRHIVLSYFWLLAPILMAPVILFDIVPRIPAATIEGNAPQALIYGWLLQFSFAVVPYFFMRLFLPDEPARLGGTRFSLLAVNLGGAFLWAGIFIEPLQAALYGIAYLLWALAMLPILADLWRITRSGINRLESTADSIPAAE